MKKLILTKFRLLFIWIFILGFFPFFKGNAKDPSFYASDSKLSSGKWIKLRVQENAIYKLTYEDIQAMGINPAKAKVYGYGGWILNERFNQNDYADDLPEVPVWISGSDNKLDPGEFVLFYGKGRIKWDYREWSEWINNTYQNKWEYQHTNNPYSNYGYYFISEGNDPLRIITNAATETVSSPDILTTFDDYAVHEQDLVAVIPSGRELYGENFTSQKSQTFTFNVNNMATGEASARLDFLSTATIAGTSVSLYVNGVNFLSGTISAANTDSPGMPFSKQNNWTNNESGEITTTVTYSHPGYNAYLNYIRLNMKRYLKPDGSYTFFRNRTNYKKDCTYEISNASSGMFVMELKPDQEVQKIPAVFSNGKLTFNASRDASHVREFALINPAGSFPKPEVVGSIENQDLHALPQTDMVIITRPLYWEQANKLAQEHIKRDGLRVEVVDADKIYNEFSSGTPDATAYRRFMKMFFDRAGSNTAEKPKYLLLFGDGSHDNRRQMEKWKSISFDGYLLTYQSENSYRNDIESYVTDDYFGYLKDDATMPSANLELGIGRFPVKNISEAQATVNKIIAYMSNKDPGAWKNNMLFIGGDDIIASQQDVHITQIDNIAKSVESRNPEYLISKVYYAAFKEIKDAGYSQFPDAKRKLDQKLKDGVLLMNYVGHGASNKIARDLLTASEINLMNYKHLPLWITATCDFGRFDDVSNSAAENALLNPISGSIGLITSARTVYSPDNDALNSRVVNYMFTKENGKWPRLGDIIRKGKNGYPNKNSLCYILLGDPALTLAYPEYTVRVDSINGEAVGASNFQLKSTQIVSVKGSILNPAGEIDTDYNGTINTTVLDCPQELSSLNMLNGRYFLFTEYLNMLNLAKGNVTHGKFSITFPVPKEISNSEKTGKMSFYAINHEGTQDANGFFSKFFVKGVAEDGIQTTEGPRIERMYLNHESFQSGDIVNEKPCFVAVVSDSLGINRSGLGIGHDIILSIDNKAAYTYPLNSYYEADSKKSGYGTIRFNIPDSLAAGEHTLTFRIWNIMNLSSYQTVNFSVETGKAPIIYDLTANPNPARTEVYFNFKHDRPETLVKVRVSVFDLAGCPVWDHEESGYTDELSQTPIHWDLISSAGNRVKPGIYVYRASISSKYGKEATESKKLIILAQ